jgi:hypothetical protein
MTLDARKLNLIQWMLILQNENYIADIENLQKKYQKQIYEAKFKPMSIEELNIIIEEAEDDIKNNRVYSHEEVVTYFANKK